MMKFVIAMMMHETHTFVPDTVPLRDFNIVTNSGPFEGKEAAELIRGSNTATAAFIDLAESVPADYVVPVAGMAWPFGPTQDAAFEYMSDKIIAAVRKGCDAAFLDLHGAMATESYLDAEGELLHRIRAAAPGIPIAVALDFHCIVTPKMIDNATVITIYRTIPHVDMYETGKRAGTTLIGFLRGESRPRLVAKRIPLMASLEKMSEKTPPMKDLIDMIHDMEETGDGILHASLSGGHPFSDIFPNGMTAVMVVDENITAGETAAEKLLQTAWENREGLIFQAEPFPQTLAYARSLAEGPIIMADSGDIPSSGGYGADMAVLKKAIAMGFEDIGVGPVCDSESAVMMFEAGVGEEVTLDLGGKTKVPLLDYTGAPLRMTGRVTAVSDTPITLTGPMLRGIPLSLGRMAVLSTGTMDILVTEKRGVFHQ
jgi:microcystin degradation protein MlrC